MDDAQGTYNYEDEGKIFGMGVGAAVTESNGHGEDRKGESMNLVETIKSLQKDVQSYKVDNEKLMKAKEQQEGFNIKLMQNLDIIEKKMDKETESSKSGSHRSHDERRRTISVGRHHHHSPRHSTRRAHSSSSPFPVRKHKKRSGVDELQGEMNKIKPPTFDGEHKKDEDAETWLLGMRKYFQLHNYSSGMRNKAGSVLQMWNDCLRKLPAEDIQTWCAM
jgi:hypothetical protein